MLIKSDKQPKSIDFLQPVYSPTDIWSNAYLWLTEVGKYLLIAVEVVVLAVFFSRFILDKKNNDLTEEVNNKIVLLSNDSWKRNSILFSNYQALLSDVIKIREGQDINSSTVSELINGVPSSLKIETFSFTAQRVSFYLSSNSLESVKNYETALKNNPDYKDVKFSINKERSELNIRVSFSLIEPK
ncbi:MAG: hypothetical protein PHE21_02475 [Candidatus Dojkabacteria bacterium]|nr:hypothetical protein [Candidatus Dojkabacteria bacterium]